MVAPRSWGGEHFIRYNMGTVPQVSRVIEFNFEINLARISKLKHGCGKEPRCTEQKSQYGNYFSSFQGYWIECWRYFEHQLKVVTPGCRGRRKDYKRVSFFKLRWPLNSILIVIWLPFKIWGSWGRRGAHKWTIQESRYGYHFLGQVTVHLSSHLILLLLCS